MRTILWQAAVLLAVVGGAVLYGKAEQRRADKFQREMDAAIAADAAREAAAAQRDSAQRDSIATLEARARVRSAQATAARRHGDSAVVSLRASLTEAQQAQLDSVLAAHALEREAADAALVASQEATRQALVLAAFWQAQNDTTSKELADLRKDYLKVAKRPSRCGLVGGVGFTGGYNIAAGATLSLGCRI